jgi:hypothetical protein
MPNVGSSSESLEPREDKYDLRATARFSLGVLRSDPIAKIINIKITV